MAKSKASMIRDIMFALEMNDSKMGHTERNDYRRKLQSMSFYNVKAEWYNKVPEDMRDDYEMEVYA